MYTCPVCHKNLSCQKALTYHIEHKSCQKIKKKWTCTGCNGEFASKQSLQYHTDHDVCGAAKAKTDSPPSPALSPPASPTTSPSIPIPLDPALQSELIAKLQRENIELKAEVRVLKEHPQTVNIVVPPAFLSVDTYKHFIKNLPQLLHDAISEHTTKCIPYLIEQTNCNPQLPLYNSVKLTNKKDAYVQISDGKKYVYKTKKQIIKELIENKRSILQQYFDDHRDECGRRAIEKFERYTNYLDDNDEAQKDLENEVICMLLNVSDVIGSDGWSKQLLEDLKMCEEDDE